MGDWAARRAGNRFEAFNVDGSYYGTISVGGSTYTYGSWQQMIAATAFDADHLDVVMFQGDSQEDYAVDIGIGAAASEQVIAEKLRYSAPTTPDFAGEAWYRLPLHIPAGSRLAVRAMTSDSGLVTPRFGGILTGAGLGVSGQRCQLLGTGGQDTEGVAVTSGASGDAKGSWTELAAAVDFDVRWLSLAFQPHSRPVGASNCRRSIDVGVGGSGSEQVLIPDLGCRDEVAGDYERPHVVGPFPVQIPAGTRVTVRHAAQFTSTTQYKTVLVTGYAIG